MYDLYLESFVTEVVIFDSVSNGRVSGQRLVSREYDEEVDNGVEGDRGGAAAAAEIAVLSFGLVRVHGEEGKELELGLGLNFLAIKEVEENGEEEASLLWLILLLLLSLLSQVLQLRL